MYASRRSNGLSAALEEEEKRDREQKGDHGPAEGATSCQSHGEKALACHKETVPRQHREAVILIWHADEHGRDEIQKAVCHRGGHDDAGEQSGGRPRDPIPSPPHMGSSSDDRLG